MKKTTRWLAVLIGAFLYMSTHGYCIITVTSIQMDPAQIEFFDYDASGSRFLVENIGDGSTIDVQQGDIGTTSGAYKFDGSLVITPSDMSMAIEDAAMFENSSDGTVSSITISATRVWKEGGSDVFTGTVTLLEAEMTSSSWILQERSDNAEIYIGETNFEIMDGELFDGIKMSMEDFTLFYALNGASPPNQSFTQDMTSSDGDIKLQAPIPEPASLLMLGLGGILCFRRKK